MPDIRVSNSLETKDLRRKKRIPIPKKKAYTDTKGKERKVAEVKKRGKTE
jgi:hypothetical protein